MKLLPVLALAATAAHAETSLTIYNQNLAVVRDIVPLDLQPGTTTVAYDRATAQVRPDSVVLRDPAGNAAFSVLEQSYRADVASQPLLLDQFVGQTIDFRDTYADGTVAIVPGRIIRSGYNPGGGPTQPIIEVDGKLRFELPGTPLFPQLGNDSILRPTLSWQIASENAAKFDAQLSYLSGGFEWSADYNVVAPEKGETVAINGWVTLSNRSGTGFSDASVKLVAGDVNITQPELSGQFDAFAARATARERTVQQKAFDDFHLYSLPRPVDLRDQETKQVEFLRAPQVEARKTYLYDPAAMFAFRGGRNIDPLQGFEFPKDVAIYWTFRNSEENGLGVPLPAGTIRFYREDSADGNLEFVGENRIDHTPQGETLEVNTGNAFDLVGERTIVNFARNDREDWMSETVQVTLRNRSKEPKTITAREHLWRWSNWEIREPSAEFQKTDANTIEFEVTLQPDEERVLTYTAHYSW